MVTVCDCDSSLVLKDQDQVPLWPLVCVMFPTEVVTVTVSPESGSENVPEFVAVCPSVAVEVAFVRVTDGGLSLMIVTFVELYWIAKPLGNVTLLKVPVREVKVMTWKELPAAG